MRKRSRKKNDDGLDFWQPTSDLMSGLMYILMLIIVLLALQVFLLIRAFGSIQSMQRVYAALQILNVGLIIHLVNKPSNPTTKITWILLVVLAPGGFIVLGCCMGAFRAIQAKLAARKGCAKPEKAAGCAGCALAGSCSEGGKA